MQNEEASNSFCAMLAASSLPTYADDATFVLKSFPVRESIDSAQLALRIAKAKGSSNTKRRQLTRRDFPPGSPGFFILQATFLMAAVEDISHPQALSVVDLPHVRFHADGSATFTVSTGDVVDDPEFQQRRLAQRLGRTMSAAMISAFACELAMKAIALTADDHAAKSHDLLALHNGLPQASRRRIAADFPAIETVLEAGRHTFGTWRYFETANAEAAAQSMIDTAQARSLAKAARVILDEAEMMGLGGGVEIHANVDITHRGDTQTHRLKLNINATGNESPPNHD